MRTICGKMGCCLSNPLLIDILRRLEQFPNAHFWGASLKTQFPKDFEVLCSAGLLRIHRSNPPDDSSPCPSGSSCEAASRDVVETNGKLWAVCTCPAEQPPILVTRDQLYRYAFDIAAFVRLLRDGNGLGGHQIRLTDRFTLAGELTVDDRAAVWVFALLAQTEESVTLLDSLRARLPRSVGSIVVLTPSYIPPPGDAVRLEGHGVFVVSGVAAWDFKLATETVVGATATAGSGVPASWPDSYFQDEDGTWLTARILADRFDIPDSRLKDWREQGCPDLSGQPLAAKKASGVGWVYFRMHVNQIANCRDDKGKVEAKLDIESRLEAAAQMKKGRSGNSTPGNSR